MRRESALVAVSECQGRRQDVKNGDGHKKLPAEVHQLVIAEARKRAAHPDIEQKEGENLYDKPDDRENRARYRPVQNIVKEMAERGGGATEEGESSGGGTRA